MGSLEELSNSTVYLRDDFVPFQEAHLSIASAPILYGLSVYTVFGVSTQTDVTQQLAIFRLQDHYKRLLESTQIVDFDGFKDEWSFDRFSTIMQELVKRNNVQQDVLVRATVFIDELLSGTRMHGLKTSLSAFLYPLKPLYGKEAIEACVSSWQRTPDNSIPSRAKVNGSYINSALMKNEALVNGYDEAIAVDEHGHVSEGSVANMFIVRDGQLITPDTATDILEGITRNTVLALANDLGIKHQQRSIDRSELYLADEAFMCGSSAWITPVISIDRRPVSSGQPGPVTDKIKNAYEASQRGSNTTHPEWLLVV